MYIIFNPKNIIINSLTKTAKMNQAKKNICKYGNKCYRKNADHLKNFDHESSETTPVSDENTCPDSNSSNENDAKSVESKRDDIKTNQKLTTEPAVGNDTAKKAEVSADKSEASQLKDIKSLVLEVNQMQMPQDFYDLVEFCTFLNSEDPKRS